MRFLTLSALLFFASCCRVASASPVTYNNLISAPAPSARAQSLSAIAPVYTLVKVGDDFPDAKCLDGSKGAYYYLPAASPSSSTKWRLFFEGGGWCISDDDCLARSRSFLGTTNGLPSTSSNPSGYCGSSFLSSDPSISPGFSDWNAVFFVYCDGSSWTSSNSTATIVNATRIFYNGRNIRDAVILDLRKLGLDSATEVVVGGCSAGGLSAILNLDAVRNLLPASTRVRGLADAGYFLDSPDKNGSPFRTPLFRWGYNAWNSSQALSSDCLAAEAEGWRCIMAQYAAPYINTPLFLLNSALDSCQANGCELGIDISKGWRALSASDQDVLVKYGATFRDAMQPLVKSAVAHGGFVTSCLVHCSAGDAAWSTTKIGGVVMNAAFEAWYKGNVSLWLVDSCAVPPCNPTCS